MNFEVLTSRKNQRIVSAAFLSDKKERDKTGLFAVEGIKLLEELLLERVKIKELFFTERAYEKGKDLVSSAKNSGAEVFCVTDEVYMKLTEEKNPEGFFAVAEKTRVYEYASDVPGDGGFLILDSIQNPSNVGAVIRTACALGISKILLSPDCADIFSKKTLRAAMGTLFKVNVCVCRNICLEMKELSKNGAHICAAALDESSEDIRKVSFSKNDSIVVGNEGRGITPDVLSLCDRKIIIPMQMGAESLNAASAAAIIMWEKQKDVMP